MTDPIEAPAAHCDTADRPARSAKHHRRQLWQVDMERMEAEDCARREEIVERVRVAREQAEEERERRHQPRLQAPGWTAERQRAFIEHLAAEGCVSLAARAVGLSKQSAYQLRDRSPNSIFALAWSIAIQRSRRILLDRSTERALTGEERSIFQRGQEVGTRIVHNDRLLMFLIGLKRDPVHPNLSDHELAELWPTMLDRIDAVLPPTLDEERQRELTDS